MIRLYKDRYDFKEPINDLYSLLYYTKNGRLLIVLLSVLLASTCGLLAGITFASNLEKGLSLVWSSAFACLVLSMPMPIIYFVNKD